MKEFQDNLEQLVRRLRDELYQKTEYRHAHEREWEDEDAENARERSNAEAKREWDAETDEMIRECLIYVSEPTA